MKRPTLPGEWDDLVVVSAGTPWDGPWMPEKHIAVHLSRRHPVLYVDPPTSIRPRRRSEERSGSSRGPRLEQVAPSIARLRPVVLPGMHRLRLPEGNEMMLRHWLRAGARRLTPHVRAVIAAGGADIFGGCGERVKVAYVTDDWVAGAALMGLPQEGLRRGEARLARRADVIVTVSPVLTDKWRALGREPVMIPNGCDAPAFARADECLVPDDVTLPRPIAGFVGHLSDRIDPSLLEAVAERGRSLLLVGPRQGTFDMRAMDRLLRLPNVRWVGPKPFEQLPSYLRIVDVGLTPYRDTAFNRASFPLKTLEYLAAGRAAVATDLPCIRWLDTDMIVTASEPGAFADAVDIALGERRTALAVDRRRAFAARHSWESRAREFAELLHVQESAAPVVPAGDSAWVSR